MEYPLPFPANGKARIAAGLRFQAGNGPAQPIRSTPPMYGRSTSGTVIEPSAFW